MNKKLVEIDIDMLPSRAEVVEWAKGTFLTETQRAAYEMIENGTKQSEVGKMYGRKATTAAETRMETALAFADIVNPLRLYNEHKDKGVKE